MHHQYGNTDDEEEETLTEVTVDYTTEPSEILMRIELHKVIKEAFKKLNYREREMINAHLGLRSKCRPFYSLKRYVENQSKKYIFFGKKYD